jgi:hypothetical protein
MEVTAKQWRYGGAAVLAGVSSLILTVGVMTVWVPIPIYLMLLAWTTVILFPLLTPALYLLTLQLAARSKHFSSIILVLVVAFAALSAWYFDESWQYGIQYQGSWHTKVVALESVVGFGATLLIAIWATAKQSKFATYLANLLLFVLLSWCAFPYLGELP